jgi:YD repeat-containing protein
VSCSEPFPFPPCARASCLHDELGRVTCISNPQDAVHYEYDDVTGQLTRTWTGPDIGTLNTDVRYEYDVLGRLTKVTMHSRDGAQLATPEATEYVYDTIGKLDALRSGHDCWAAAEPADRSPVWTCVGHRHMDRDTLIFVGLAAGVLLLLLAAHIAAHLLDVGIGSWVKRGGGPMAVRVRTLIAGTVVLAMLMAFTALAQSHGCFGPP